MVNVPAVPLIPEGTIDAYVINLPRNTRRLQHFQQQVNASDFPIPVTVLPAVDGYALPDEAEKARKGERSMKVQEKVYACNSNGSPVSLPHDCKNVLTKVQTCHGWLHMLRRFC